MVRGIQHTYQQSSLKSRRAEQNLAVVSLVWMKRKPPSRRFCRRRYQNSLVLSFATTSPRPSATSTTVVDDVKIEAHKQEEVLMEELWLLRMVRIPTNFKWQLTSGTDSMSSLSVCQDMMQSPTMDDEEGIESPLDELDSALGLKLSRVVVHSETSIPSPIAAPPAEAPTSAPAPAQQNKNLRILVAGGGIGGLVFARAANKKGFDVVVFENDLSTVKGEGQCRGPIQIQSNALAVLEAIDVDVADEVMRVGCVTGDDIIINSNNVVNFEDVGDKVNVILENGERFEGDILVGPDGIWSKVRKNLFGLADAVYSGYTCYIGIADFVPADINYVGYRVFLGHKQYFVSSDVGAGKMQWYAFHKEAPGGVDSPSSKKERLLKIFEGWCDNVIDLLLATEEDAILRRDIYDRTHNLGKGSCDLAWRLCSCYAAKYGLRGMHGH
ncbi:hypothetical protein ACFX10_036023 [Malus domestica]